MSGIVSDIMRSMSFTVEPPDQPIYEEEISQQARLIELYHQTFGDHVLFIRTHDVKGFLKQRPFWLRPLLRPKIVLAEVMRMEAEAGPLQ